MSRHVLCRTTLGLALAGAAMGTAYALTVFELQQLLQSAPARSVSFHEIRESPWLAAPVESQGTMRSSPDRLEKRVVAPHEETWSVLSDRMEWVGPAGTASKQVMFSDAPAVATLANALRRIVSGDLLALEQDFRIELRGNEELWTVRMQPRGDAAARALDSLELQGAGGRLQVIVILEREGERTTTRFDP